MVELKNGETYNGTLKNSDVWMNLHLIEAICTDSVSFFWFMRLCLYLEWKPILAHEGVLLAWKYN